MTRKPIWSIVRYCALLVIGNAMFALGFNLFLVPNSLNVGGLSGIAMILQRLLGRGGTESGTHTLAEWFDPAGVWVCEQKSILLLLALAGIEGELEPLGETL